MLNLSNVTLLCVETRDPELAHWAIDRCLAGTHFAKVVLITNIDLVKLLCAQMDEKLGRAKGESEGLITYVKDRPGHDRRYAIDASKVERELGWRPAETFDTGIRKTVQWYLDNPEWVQGVLTGSYRDWLDKQYHN